MYTSISMIKKVSFDTIKPKLFAHDDHTIEISYCAMPWHNLIILPITLPNQIKGSEICCSCLIIWFYWPIGKEGANII